MASLYDLSTGAIRRIYDRRISGAPVLDCNGRVVAVVSNLFTRTMQLMSRAIRVSTAWGSPNVVSVPIQALRGYSRVE